MTGVAMTVAVPGQMPAILGFAFPAGAALALSAVLMTSYPPRLETVAEAETIEQPSGMTHVYITLDAPIFISVGIGRRMRLDLAVAVKGTGEQLRELNAQVDGAQSRLRAEIVAVAEALAREGADGATVHATLPERSRTAINAMLGTEEFPEPVAEILILGLAVMD